MQFNCDFKGLILKKALTWRSIMDKSVEFLLALESRREELERLSRPLIYLCHSFGGLILKNALRIAQEEGRWRQLFDQTQGIIFIGCLHDERVELFADCCMRCAAVELGLTSQKSPNQLEKLQDISEMQPFREVQQWFRECAPKFPVMSFCQTKPTVYRVRNFFKDERDILCPEYLSELTFEDHKIQAVEMDHLQMAAFPERTHTFYQLLLDQISKMIERCTDAIIVEGAPDKTSGQQGVGEGFSLESTSVRTPDEFEIIQPLVALPDPQNLRTEDPKLPCYMIEYSNNFEFIGRSNILNEMEERLLPSRRIHPRQMTYVLSGLGGIGKTQTALKFAYQGKALGEYRAILWAPAATKSKLADAYLSFAIELNLVEAGETNTSTGREALMSWFEITDEPWLVILDNLDSEDKEKLLEEFRPLGHSGAVIITSRDKRLTDSLGGRVVENLDEMSALEMLWSLTKQREKSYMAGSSAHEHERTAARQIVNKLDCYPLAISTAAGVIINDQCELSEFEESFSVADMIQEPRYPDLLTGQEQPYSHTLLTVWDMNFEALSGENRALLHTLAFLDPDSIPAEMLMKGIVSSAHPSLDFVNSKLKWLRGRAPLLKSSLISQTSDDNGSGLKIHRVMRELFHLRMTADQRQLAFSRATIIVCNAWPAPERHNLHNPTLWPEQLRYLPHVRCLHNLYLASKTAGQNVSPLEVGLHFGKLLYLAAWYLIMSGVYEQAESLLRTAETSCKDLPNADSVLADIHGGLAFVLRDTNCLEEAFREYNLQIGHLERAFGSGLLHRPDVREAVAHGALANGLGSLHRYEEAETEYRKSIAIWKSCPGSPQIVLRNLAVCVRLQGNFEEAEKILEELIVDREDTSSSQTGAAMYNLGNLRISQAERLLDDERSEEASARFEEAWETHRQTLNLFRAVLGERHPWTAEAYYKCGWHLHRKGQYAEAEGVIRVAVGIWEKGGSHRNEVARATYKLGCVLQDSGRGVEGRMLLLGAEEMRRGILGYEIPVARTEGEYDELVMFLSR